MSHQSLLACISVKEKTLIGVAPGSFCSGLLLVVGCLHVFYHPNSLAIGFLMAVLVIYPGFPGFLVARVPNRVPNRVPKGA